MAKSWDGWFTGTAALVTLVTASGCATIPIRNSRWYADVGSRGALYRETQTTAKGTVPVGQWDDMRFGMLCTTASTFADWKATIEKLCSVSGKCTYEIKQQINEVFSKMEMLNLDAQAMAR